MKSNKDKTWEYIQDTVRAYAPKMLLAGSMAATAMSGCSCGKEAQRPLELRLTDPYGRQVIVNEIESRERDSKMAVLGRGENADIINASQGGIYAYENGKNRNIGSIAQELGKIEDVHGTDSGKYIIVKTRKYGEQDPREVFYSYFAFEVERENGKLKKVKQSDKLNPILEYKWKNDVRDGPIYSAKVNGKEYMILNFNGKDITVPLNSPTTLRPDNTRTDFTIPEAEERPIKNTPTLEYLANLLSDSVKVPLNAYNLLNDIDENCGFFMSGGKMYTYHIQGFNARNTTTQKSILQKNPQEKLGGKTSTKPKGYTPGVKRR